MRAFLDHTADVGKQLRMFWFRPDHAFNYTAGQFIEMKLPHQRPDERGQKRWFTLSSSPSEDLIAITTRLFPEKRSSFKQQLAELKAGDGVNISEPMGDFVLPKNKARPLLFVVGGIGVTPVRSMVKWLLDTHEVRDITVLYAAHEPAMFAFLDLFKTYGLKLTQFVTDTSNKHLSAAQILELATPGALIYISGPEPMTETLVKQLGEKGIAEEQLVTDYFPGYSAVL